MTVPFQTVSLFTGNQLRHFFILNPFNATTTGNFKAVMIHDFKQTPVPIRRNDDVVIQNDYKYFTAIGIHKSSSISFAAYGENETQIDLGIDIADVGSIGGDLAISGKEVITVEGTQRLVYGIELSELIYDSKKQRFDLAITKNYQHVMGEGNNAFKGIHRSTIGSEDDEFIIDWAEQ